MNHVVVIGAGSAGLMAAVSAAMEGAKVTLLEKNDQIGKKLLSTGNGKCNFSHLPVKASDYQGSLACRLSTFFETFDTDDFLHFLDQRGFLWKNCDGYLYPYSEQAASMKQFWEIQLQKEGIELITAVKCKGFGKNQDSVAHGNWILEYGKGETITADAVIVATGGLAAPKTGSSGDGNYLLRKYGVPMMQEVPALSKLKCADAHCKAFAGVRAEATISFCGKDGIVVSEFGEIQFTEDGLSGIPVFQISRHIAYALQKKKTLTCEIDLFPKITNQQLAERIGHKISPGATYGMVLNGTVNIKLIDGILQQFHVTKEDVAKPDLILQMLHFMKKMSFQVVKVYDFDYAQVTAGGVVQEALDDHLMLKEMPGIFVAGELCDVDGRCGGYNLQWAWTSGWITGKAAAQYRG